MRFMQISAVPASQWNVMCVFALDFEGRVWWLDWDEGEPADWRLMSSPSPMKTQEK
jgi:hypothetical protein